MPGTNTPSAENLSHAATYASLFPEQLADRCSPDALESNSGPMAYLHALYQQALALEATSTSNQRFTLAQRRPDIGELLLNEEGLEKELPPLTLAINALTRQAQSHAGEETPLAQAIGEAQLRAGLPFHYPLEQIKAVLRHKKLPLFDLLQSCEYSFPNFCQGNLRTDELRQVMRTATGFSPALQRLLLDDSAPASKNFLASRFGMTGTNASVIAELNSVENFCQKTGLGPEDVQDLLAIAAVNDGATEVLTRVKRSSAYQVAGSEPTDGKRYGAVFINNNEAQAVSLEDTLSGPGIKLAIKGATAGHYGRIHKLIHLAHALELSFAETDLLLMSALRAEGQTDNFHITANTLRAIGVFRFFNEAYGINVEQFAALIHEVSPYAVGDRVPFLDRVLDGPGSGQVAEIDDRLSIDNGTFDPGEKLASEGNSPSTSTMGRLCRALGLSEQMASDYLKQTTKALGQRKPRRSLAMLSSLYRRSRLPSLLRLSADEGANLIALLTLGNGQVQGIMAGRGQISDEPDKADILDVLVALANMQGWLRRNGILPSAVLSLLTVPALDEQVLAQIQTARDKALGETPPDVRGTCLSEQSIASVLKTNETLKTQTDTWLAVLENYLDDNGLIKPGLPAEPALRDALTTLLTSKLKDSVDATSVTQTLASQLINARIKQEDLAKDVFSRMFANVLDQSLASSYALALLKWIHRSPRDLLADLLAPIPANAQQRTQSFTLWSDMARYTLAISLTGLSPAGLQALVQHPRWFKFDDDTSENSEVDATTLTPTELNLDLLFQLTRYRAWVGICRDNGHEENDALGYLASVRPSTDPAAVEAATRRLGKLIGWDANEALLAAPHLIATPVTSRQEGSKSVTANEPAKKSGTLDAFISRLSADELKAYTAKGAGLKTGMMLSFFHEQGHKNYSDTVNSVNGKLKKFLSEHPGPLLVTAEQYEAAYKPDDWAQAFKQIRASGETPVLANPLELRVIGTPIEDPTPSKEVPTADIEERTACVPATMADIDFVLRLQSLSARTGLSSQSLVNLSWLDEASSYQEFHTAGLLLLGACTDTAREAIEPGLQTKWRDALADYLLGYWGPVTTGHQSAFANVDDLSSYLLTDISVTWEARKTTAITQAISSLQHYLFRLFSHLEPGYDAATLPAHANSDWEQYLSQYGTWKQWRAQMNHPENLIYYANRPKKTVAFEELEVEVNQGKLNTDILETAVLNYLNKFERLSNLQVVSGYLDGRDPKNDTYYLIGKTNSSPTEYYMRSVDMGLRDDQQRLSPLAWTEWKKIALTTTGEILQSSFNETFYKKDKEGTVILKDGTPERESPDIVHTCDAIRPVIIAGRPYVFWVERGTTGLPSADLQNQKPTAYKRLSVQYAYLQSDGFWSTANELMRLDGTEDGKRLPDKDNRYLKDDSYIPGLIAFVNVEGPRRADPWLTVILYNAAKEGGIGEINDDYFVEMRDLLLIDRKTLVGDDAAHLAALSYGTYKDIRNVQHTYDGQTEYIYVQDLGKDSTAGTKDFPVKEYDYSGSGLKIEVQTPMNSFDLEITVSLDQKVGRVNTYTPANSLYFHLVLSVTEPGKRTPITIEERSQGVETTIISTFSYKAPKAGEYTFRAWFKVGKVDHILLKESSFQVEPLKKDEVWDITIRRDVDQAQYLDLTSVKSDFPILASDSVRLNTLFGKNLIARASQSVGKALSWDTQNLREPTIDAAYPTPSIDFHGANGLYFRELFLHLPAMVATRLTEQQQYEDAETWYLRYLFDPYRALPDEDGRPAYWNTRPLAQVGTLVSELNKQVDPTARAFILSRYYRQAVFLNLVENWQQQGDHYYRQLSLSSLNHAWLCYQQALKLIGPLPERVAVSRWNPVALSSVAQSSFRIPMNKRVAEARKILERRLYNLRHGLTIDGKVLPKLAWGDEGGDPFSSAKGGLSIIATTYNSDREVIPAYRFREMLTSARAAAQQLLDMGRHYMKLMENEFNTSLSVLLKSQEIKLSDFTLRLQKEAISGVQARKRQLEVSRQTAEFRAAFYANQIAVGRNPREEAATALTYFSHTFNAASVPLEAMASGIKGVLPIIFGVAFGGNEPDSIAFYGAKAMQLASKGSKLVAEQLLVESAYDRRATGWQFELDQANWDVKLIEQQIAEIDIELNAASISLDEARQERKNLEEAYTAMTTGFTIIPIYNWLVARQEQIYGAAYDAVLSMCLGLEAAWRYEIGDYKRAAFIKTSAWNGSHKGMLAGESLLVDLLEMENAYLRANERRLTIRKSFSLSALFSGADTARASGTLKGKPLSPWEHMVLDLSEGKPVMFDLKAHEFDKNYPGHYLRQLKYVTVSFTLDAPANPDGLCAVLTQTGSTTLVDADEEGVEYLYGRRTTVPSSVKRNLRAQQAIALSSAVTEDGLGYNPNESVHELAFHEGRYLPFEGTGAISRWELKIPDLDFAKTLATLTPAQAPFIKSNIPDIQINLVYTALMDNHLPAMLEKLRSDISTEADAKA
jgi:hypothetical protein